MTLCFITGVATLVCECQIQQHNICWCFNTVHSIALKLSEEFMGGISKQNFMQNLISKILDYLGVREVWVLFCAYLCFPLYISTFSFSYCSTFLQTIIITRHITIRVTDRFSNQKDPKSSNKPFFLRNARV